MAPILAMVVMLFGTQAAYAEGAAKISVGSVTASPGSTVRVDVSITDNPGILGGIMKVDYDESLTLVNGENGEAFSALAMTKPGRLVPGCRFAWDGQDLSDDQIVDGTVLTLTFAVPEDAENGAELPIAVTCEDPIDTNLNPVAVETTAGKITILSFLYGDADGDGNINMTDVIKMRRYIAGGYDVTVNENAANVNCDASVNMTDVILLRRYVAGGYGIVLPYGTGEHTHSMSHTDKVEATCTDMGNAEYWMCTSCGKYFTDAKGMNQVAREDLVIPAKGHTEVVDPRVEPTTTTTGLTEGSHCSVCGEVIVAQEEIPVIEEGDRYNITYSLYDGDNYLKTVGLENKNPATYVAGKGINRLQNMSTEGYIFEGWYDGEGASATKINSISATETGDIDLYAHWTPRVYTISFDSPLVEKADATYTVNKGATLADQELFGYNFMGWSDENGNIVTKIPKGTTGNIELTANWMSKRNQTRPVKNLGSPLICEDEEAGQYFFVYEVGQIENVPLYVMKTLTNSNGITVEEGFTTSKTIIDTTQNTIVNSIANATTKSTTWSLSKDWNNSSSYYAEHTNEDGSGSSWGWEKAKSSDTLTLNTKDESNGTSNVVTTNDGLTGTVKGYAEGKIGVGKAGIEVTAEGKHEEGNSDGTTYSLNTHTGTEKSKSKSSSESASGYISHLVSDTYGYNTTISTGGSEGYASSSSSSITSTNEYASSLIFTTENVETTTKQISNANAPEGYYRLVCAGTIHVFAVVSFDISTKTYFVNTFGIQDDRVYDYVDYARNNPNFDDTEYECGVLPFEVPYEVHQYVSEAMQISDKLQIDKETGIISNYTGSDKVVIVPDYITVNDVSGHTDCVQVKGISANAFKGNTNIESIQLGKYVTEIPANAFSGCTSLKEVVAPSINKFGASAFKNCAALTSVSDLVTTKDTNGNVIGATIGNNTFEGCTSLSGYSVGKNVASIGTNAFKNVKRVDVDAASADIVRSVCASGAKRIVLYTDSVAEELTNSAISIPDTAEYFEWNGGNKTYENVVLSSKAAKTVINKVTVNSTQAVPLEIDSAEVAIGETTVTSPTWAMILGGDDVTMNIESAVSMTSSGTGTVLTMPLTLRRNSTATTAKLTLSGDLYVCGTVSDVVNNDSVLTFKRGEIVPVDSDQFESLKNDSIQWVLASEMPAGARVLASKWTYDLTTTKTSSSSTMAGYTLYNTTWVWGSYGPWSAWQNTPVSSSDSRKVETRTIPAVTKTQYRYSRWSSNSNNTGHIGPFKQTWGGYNCPYQHYTDWRDSPLAYVGTDTGYGVTFAVYNPGDNWYNQETRELTVTAAYTQYRYCDRSKVYTYHFKKVEQMESETEVTAGGNISNVQKWVKYVIQ